MDTFEVIPTETLRIIQQYLNKRDYRNLLNSSKLIFGYSKYETVYYDLYIGYYHPHQLPDSLSVFDGFVKDKSQQISITITDPTSKTLKKWADLISGIHKLIVHDYELLLKSVNVSLFCNIYHVHLKFFGKDILCGLKGVKILEIYDSSRLIAIDFIPGLKRLVLDSLINLLEISEFGNIPELQITRCPKLSLQGLGSHERVSLCWGGSYDVSIFQTVKYLDLAAAVYPPYSGLPIFANLIYLVLFCMHANSYFSFDPSYFPNIRFLNLHHAKISPEASFPSSLQLGDFNHCYFTDLSVLSNVKKLQFRSSRGRGFKNVNALSNAHKLYFYFISELEDVSSLGGVYDLTIIGCHQMKDISKLGRVHRLKVFSCGVISLEGLGQGNSDILLSGLSRYILLSPLRSIYKVTLSHCDGLANGRHLANVQHLTVHDCSNFEDTRGLGKVKSLCLVSCDKLHRLVGLKNVPHIHLEGCDELGDINCLRNQQCLIIINCRKLKKLMKEDINRYQRIFSGIPFVRINVKAFSVDKGVERSGFIPGIFDVK